MATENSSRSNIFDSDSSQTNSGVTTDSSAAVNEGKQSAASSFTSKSYGRLVAATDKSVKRITSKRRVLPYIKENFKKVYKADSENVLKLYKSMMNQLEAMIKDDFQEQLDIRNVDELLGSLDSIKTKFVGAKRTWRPSGTPKEDVKAHLQETAQTEREKLKKVLTSLESQNKLLNECTQKAENQLNQSIKTLEKFCCSWNQAAEVLTDETREELRKINLENSGYPSASPQMCGPGRT